MEWLKNFINFGLKGKELNKTNKELNKNIDRLGDYIANRDEIISEMTQIQKDLRKERDLLQKKYNNGVLKLRAYTHPKDLTEDTFFKKTNVEYRWQPKKKTLLRYSLDNFSKDQDSIGLFTGFY